MMGLVSNAAKYAILYDDTCAMCAFQMKLLTWMDWFHSFRLVPMSSAETQELAPELTPEQLSAAIHCITPQKDIHRGARCIRFASMRMPLLFPLGLFLWIPGVIVIAEIIYKWISENRYILSKLFGCKDACSILPQKKRKDESEIATPDSSKTS